MVLKKIKLKNFRNYDNLFIEFDDKINILIGDNAQGKTNILESIYVLALTKSHKLLPDNNLIKNEKNISKIKGSVIKKNISNELEIIITNHQKITKINNNKILRLTDYISNLKVIMFCPDDLEIIKGSPGIRRNYINIELAQISKKYLKILNEYNKILKMRNEYLKIMVNKNIEEKSYYEIITNNLIERAIKIHIIRKKFIDDINLKLNKIYKNITKQENLQLKYDSFIDKFSENENIMKTELSNKFSKIFNKELQQGITLIGPHRDDFSFILDGKDLKNYGSQGQQRTAILSLKISEIDIFKKMTNDYPILLLDDVFSELDRKKINNILKYINKKVQTIITTTDINNIKKQVVDKAKIFNIKDGNIKIKQEVK